MIVFLDSSSLIKLYVDEPDAAPVRRLVVESAAVAVSHISRVEATSALARRRREGHLDDGSFAMARAALDADWPSYAVVDLDDATACALVQRHPLRAMDAVQLAAALGIAATVPGTAFTFVSHDGRLADAARAEGLAVVA
ncbi:VapC toxin family PIN domain ribonuclease [bacterium]|nr:PIN domain-containing protein [Chloroflexi bacterium CFX6]RIL10852.1 MAG: VapC toxin family PIN domain ribonuclease [bacterium]